MTAPPPLPRWFLCLPLIAVVAWWPLSPYWKSDDFLALHYACDLGRALGDFVGPQYGATDVWWFYRPLITLSFWADQCLGGSSPFPSHLSNVLAHGCSALLVGLLWRRFLPDRRAFLAGLLWALMPGHQAAILWAVGRVDSHATVWCLAALWSFLRQRERAQAGQPVRHWPTLLAATAAFATKELAFVVAPLATLLAFLTAPSAPSAGAARAALRASAPLWLLLAAYTGFRLVVLGRLGGYDAMQFDAGTMATGLLRVVADLLVPLRWSGLPDGSALGLSRSSLLWAAAVPILAAGVMLWWRPRLCAALALFVVACAPMAAFLASAENPHNLRYYYLPSIALAGLIAAPGRFVAGLALLAWLWPFVAVRADVAGSDRQTATMHAAMLRAADGHPPAPLFVAGLPHANATGTSLQFHFGVDRALEPPFRREGVRLLALRPIVDGPGTFRLDPAGSEPAALPGGSTWWFSSPAELVRCAAAAALPDLPIEGDAQGVVDLGADRLAAMERRTADVRLATRAGRPQCFRITIFTATGYFCCLCPDHGPPDATNGTIDLLQFFAGDLAVGVPRERSRVPPAQFAPGAYVMTGLQVPTTHDLVPEFPVLVEAGSLAGDRFLPTHRARRLLTFRFDRGYPAWVRHALGIGG